MNIGLVIYGSLDTLSGGYMYDRKLVEYLRAQGDTVEIISLPYRNYAALLSDNFTFRLPPGLDVVIQDELNHASLIGANAGKHSCPVISLVHHLRCSELRPRWQNMFYRMVEKCYLHSVDGFIFNSKTTQGVVNGLIGNGKPAIVAYPPTDRFGAALPEAFVAGRAAEPGPLRIAFLGNVISRKGLHTLLEAVSCKPLDVRLNVIGSLTTDSIYAAQMQEKANSLNLKSKVTFHGPKDNSDLADMLLAAHVLVVPSSYEGFGIVYLEGMAFGLPAIGTTAGAAGEVISNGETGYLVTSGDAEMLAARLQVLASDRDLLAKLSLNALKRYQQQPTWEQTAGDIREFLQKIMENHATA